MTKMFKLDFIYLYGKKSENSSHMHDTGLLCVTHRVSELSNS